MKYNKFVFCLLLLSLFSVSIAFAAKAEPSSGTKRLDLTKYHNVGNIWLRVSNYGFFGSGDDIVPRYPSLEYPGGSGIDYLYQGALWFGAKKQRRDALNRKLYWKVYPPSAINDTLIYEDQEGWDPSMLSHPVIDTLVTVGFDGDLDNYELLPAYNPLLVANTDYAESYNLYNALDQIASASVRTQQRGVDDDGDGLVDEDFVGYTFPFRKASELPSQFSAFGSKYIHQMGTTDFAILDDPKTLEIWFPLGFMDLSDRSFTSRAFSARYDDDGDGRFDEDGAPVSEQDFISYYYDYCPFGTEGDRDYGSRSSGTKHYPLNIFVRQMSYQWSYDYIKNLVYVEFDITNMNHEDTLMDCAMGIYMDCDVGPQSWGREKAADDVSGYVKGEGYEFAYTRDADGDGGLTTGLVGARVCTPDPDVLEFHCWYWKVGDGPDDSSARSLDTSNPRTANEKYWLLTGRNPNTAKFSPLRPESDDTMEFEQPVPNDTRFLFSFYGAQPGTPEYDDPAARWNLAPDKTMKIVVAVFPGDNKEDLKRSATWAKTIYGEAQDLITVVLPDTFPHYHAPGPPDIPNLYAEMVEDGNRIDLYWDNRSEFSYDVQNVSTADIGWQRSTSETFIPGLDSDPTDYINNGWPPEFPDEFKPDFADPGNPSWNNNAKVNPWTGHRLRHDFQGYTVWGRSGSGNREDWEMIRRWDKVDTPIDLVDYTINHDHPLADSLFKDFGGYMGIDTDLPNPSDKPGGLYTGWVASPEEYAEFWRLDENYALVPNGSVFYGWPLYKPGVDWSPAIEARAREIAEQYQMLTEDEIMAHQARIFMHDHLQDSPEVFDHLYDRKMIPLKTFAFPGGADAGDPSEEDMQKVEQQRLARRYYRHHITHPRKGVEYYVAVTAFDRGIPYQKLESQESGRDADANMKVFFPGSLAKQKMDDIKVIPNPYIGSSKFDGRYDSDEKGDKSRRLWFINLPERCTIRIYTLAGDLVQTLNHDGATQTDIVTISKAATTGMAASGMQSWDLLTRNNQITAPGVYLFSVENKADDKIKVGKFVIIK